jgi:hypothetical protein
MKMTALEVVGALIAFAGTALVINTLFWLDGASSSESPAQLPSESVAKPRRAQRKAA